MKIQNSEYSKKDYQNYFNFWPFELSNFQNGLLMEL